MPNSLDNAIARIQDIAATLTTIPPTGTVMSSENDYPSESVQPLPFSLAYLGGGSFTATNATVHHNFPVIKVEMHFQRSNLKLAYQQITAAAIEFPKRLVADPTLGGTVVTIVFGRDESIQYTVRPAKFSEVATQLLEFNIPVKLLETPQTTA